MEELVFVLALFTLITIILSIYFFPSIIAYRKKHTDRTAIFVLNLFAGWSFAGWVIALVWSFKKS